MFKITATESFSKSDVISKQLSSMIVIFNTEYYYINEFPIILLISLDRIISTYAKEKGKYTKYNEEVYKD